MSQFQVFDYSTASIPSNPGTIWFFRDEWETKQRICEGFVRSKRGENQRKIGARECVVEEICRDEAVLFLGENHLQGDSRRSQVRYGLRCQGDLVGMVSLSPHHRQTQDKVIVLDRLCFKIGVTVAGGTSRLIGRCIAWAKDNGIDMVLTFSDNRLTDGEVYAKAGFVFDGNLRSDYFYLDPNGVRLSKQSQKKKTAQCPDGMTEWAWATQRGLRRFYDLGKKRWVLKVNPATLTKKEKLSLICAEQHSKGLFKKNRIAGEILWRGKPIYFGSSFELRFLFESEDDPTVLDIRRGDTFWTNGRARNPDFLVTRTAGQELVEVKPSDRVEEAYLQIQDSREYADRLGITFRVWTERDSVPGNERALVKWARQFLCDRGFGKFIVERMEKDRIKARRHYYLRLSERVKVSCDYCREVHDLRRAQYEKNLNDHNGRFICIVENGHLIGSRPKDHLKKVNPYAAEGKKQCNRCGDVKQLNEFGDDKGKFDGKSTRCKKCRAAAATEKYQAKKLTGPAEDVKTKLGGLKNGPDAC